MVKRIIWITLTCLVVVTAAVPLRSSVAGPGAQPEAAAVQQMEEVIPDMSTLLNYPYAVKITDLEGEERTLVLGELMIRPEVNALMTEMAAKGFAFDPATADVMRIGIADPTGLDMEVKAMTMSTIANELSGALTAMVAADGTSFFQAHHTNLDPNLAAVPDPPIVVNGMPYFYITTLRWIGGQIIVWNYWWFNSHHHPNWYYSHYYWYWQYYWWYHWPWPYWYWWVHGWYYWRYWYYWSTWFPYLVDLPVTE